MRQSPLFLLLLLFFTACTQPSSSADEVELPDAVSADGPISIAGRAESVVVDDADTEFHASESWWASTSTPGFYGTGYTVAPLGVTGDPAAFQFDIAAEGCHTVEARWTDGPNRGPYVEFLVFDSIEELGRIHVDQRYGGGKWQSLGQYKFVAGPAEVLLSRQGEQGTYGVADAIRVTPCEISQPPSSGSLDDVPYFYQYNNAYEPGATCGVTSTAMVLNAWLPGHTTPDALYLQYGKAQGQSPSGIAAMAQWAGLYSQWTTTGTRAQIRAHLDAGRPVVAHGYWTGAGHIVVIVGYDGNDWIVNDPAGDWYTCYGCGGGERVRYPMGGSWDDRMSADGDLWFSVTSDTAF